jgi:hypothetical protein
MSFNVTYFTIPVRYSNSNRIMSVERLKLDLWSQFCRAYDEKPPQKKKCAKRKLLELHNPVEVENLLQCIDIWICEYSIGVASIP